MKQVDKNSTVPLYLQLSAIIEEMIDTGELPPGSLLLPERELCLVQDVSRMTVNKALFKLTQEGFLERRQGRGTYVSSKSISSFEGLKGLSEVMRQRGLPLKSETLSFERTTLHPFIGQKLDLDASNHGIAIKRMRYTGKEPFLFEEVYLNPRLVPGLTKDMIRKSSLYNLFSHHFGHELSRAEQTVRPVKITSEQSALLKQPIGSLALQIDRTVYSPKEEVLEYTKAVFLTQKHDYELIFKR